MSLQNVGKDLSSVERKKGTLLVDRNTTGKKVLVYAKHIGRIKKGGIQAEEKRIVLKY